MAEHPDPQHPLIGWAQTAVDRYETAVTEGDIPEGVAAAFLASDLLAASITAAQQGDTAAARWLLDRAGLAANHRMAIMQAGQVTVPDDLSSIDGD